jgi:hypothetical protein
VDPDDMQGGVGDGQKDKYGLLTVALGGERLRRWEVAIDDADICRSVGTGTPQSVVNDQKPRFFS